MRAGVGGGTRSPRCAVSPAVTRDGRRIALLCQRGLRGRDRCAALAARRRAASGCSGPSSRSSTAPAWPDRGGAPRGARAGARGAARPRRRPCARSTSAPTRRRRSSRGTRGARPARSLLERPRSSRAQLRAIARAGAGDDLRVLLPLVEAPEQVGPCARSSAALGEDRVQLGAMIETPAAARRATEIARAADFLSIGTNDLVASTLGLDRELPVASASTAADPACSADRAARRGRARGGDHRRDLRGGRRGPGARRSSSASASTS